MHSSGLGNREIRLEPRGVYNFQSLDFCDLLPFAKQAPPLKGSTASPNRATTKKQMLRTRPWEGDTSASYYTTHRRTNQSGCWGEQQCRFAQDAQEKIPYPGRLRPLGKLKCAPATVLSPGLRRVLHGVALRFCCHQGL